MKKSILALSIVLASGSVLANPYHESVKSIPESDEIGYELTDDFSSDIQGYKKVGALYINASQSSGDNELDEHHTNCKCEQER